MNLQNPNLILVIVLSAFLLVLVLMIVLFASLGARNRRQAKAQAEEINNLSRKMNDSMRQVAQLSGAMDARMDALTRTNDESLYEMRRLVGEKLDNRLNESFRLVNGQLADVHRGIGEMRDLAQNVTDLKKVLGNVKTRGVWGEMQLRAILAEMFAADQYIENAAIPEGGAARVEFALKIPGAGENTALLPIDSKFPQEDYIRLANADSAGNQDERMRCARQLERAIMEQAKTISEKYIRPPQTVDFAVMFLPVEGLYAEAARMPGLIERIQVKYRVLIAGPGTLCALLTSLQMGLRSSELEKRSGEILQMFDELRAEFARFQEGIARAKSRIDQAESELEALESRAKKIAKKLI